MNEPLIVYALFRYWSDGCTMSTECLLGIFLAEEDAIGASLEIIEKEDESDDFSYDVVPVEVGKLL